MAILLCGLQGLWSPCIGIRAPYPYTTLLALALALALARALALATTLLRHILPLRRLISEPRGNKKYPRPCRTNPGVVGGDEYRQDAGENWRRIELFIGENEHL